MREVSSTAMFCATDNGEMEDMETMVERRTWEEFRSAKLLWWANRMLHLFGWAIVVEVNDDGSVSQAYPARVRFRGFDSDSEADGFVGLTQYLAEHVEALKLEARE